VDLAFDHAALQKKRLRRHSHFESCDKRLAEPRCGRLLQVSTPLQKSDMSWQERGRSVVSGSLVLIDGCIPSAPLDAEVGAGARGTAVALPSG
jgi:hypothetical protein